MTDEWIASNAEARVSFEERPESALHKKSKYHPRQWVVHSDPFYSNSESPLESPNGSWWIVQMLSTGDWSIHPLPWVGL